MSNGIYLALSGMKAKQKELDIIANNIANASTQGYREATLSFESVIANHENSGLSADQSVPYSKVGTVKYKMEPGALLKTDNQMDIALIGQGFIEVMTPGGAKYTRNGSLQLSSEGQLVTSQGYKVSGTNGDITITERGPIHIAPNGEVTVGDESYGQIKVVKFENAGEDLSAVGGSLYEPKGGIVPESDTETRLIQGSVEQSNSNVTLNLVKMIDVSKQYQTYQKVLAAQRKAEEDLNSVGRIS